jgi:hypothetical protein
MPPILPPPTEEGSPDYYERRFAERIRRVRKEPPSGDHHRRAIALIVFLVSVVLALYRAGQADHDPSPMPQSDPDRDSSWRHFQDVQDRWRPARDPAPDDAAWPADRPDDPGCAKP